MAAPPTPAQIRATRESLGLSRVEFAKLLRVSDSTVWSWEAGHTKPLGLTTLHLKLLRAGQPAPLKPRRPIHPDWHPTPEEIAERKAKIQASWSPREWHSRAGISVEDEKHLHWQPPIIPTIEFDNHAQNENQD